MESQFGAEHSFVKGTVHIDHYSGGRGSCGAITRSNLSSPLLPPSQFPHQTLFLGDIRPLETSRNDRLCRPTEQCSALKNLAKPMLDGVKSSLHTQDDRH